MTNKNTLYQRDIISINDLTVADIELVLDVARQIKMGHTLPWLKDKIIASCFFEPSTRTRLSFEAATHKLDGRVIGFADSDMTSSKKSETLSDTIKIIDQYADAIILRHPNEGAARLAAEIAHKPVINAGDGANQHPTQTLLDLFTIKECQNKLNGLNIAFVGDLKYGRTVHSLVQTAALYDLRLYLVSPGALSLPEDSIDMLRRKGVKFSYHGSVAEVLPKADIIYMTRLQAERLNPAEIKSYQKQYMITSEMLQDAKANLRILHPLPRINEIDRAVDDTHHAYYFQQAANGIFVRQALLALILNKTLGGRRA